MGLGLGSAMQFVSDFEDDPTRGYTFIFGGENTGTSSLAYSIVDIIPEGKKVYVLMTEPAHNVTGIIKKSYRQQYDAGKFQLPATKDGKTLSIVDYTQFVAFQEALLNAKDVGAVVIDATDSLVGILYKEFAKNTNNIQGIWTSTYDAIRDFFFEINSVLIGVPVIVITKERDDAVYGKNERGGLKITPVLDEDGNQVVVPNIGKKMLRYASIRVRLYEKGKYIAMKTKGDVEESEKFEFRKDKNHKLTGILLPELFAKEKVD